MLMDAIYDYRNERGIAFNMRRKRGDLFREFIEQRFGHAKSLRIVDLGGTELFWKSVGFDFLRERGIKITLVNKKDLAIENQDLFEAVTADATQFGPHAKYDVCFSNSCIEHVGTISDMKRFSDAVRNAADTYFVQTPSFNFPVEPHFFFVAFHWLPLSVRAWLLRTFSFGHHTRLPDYLGSFMVAQSSQLLTRRLFAAIFHDGRIVRERFFGLTKSYIAVK